MTYDLFLGHPSYSSWSLRAWLMFQHFDLPMTPVWVDIYEGGKARDLAPVAPALTVPVLRLPDGTVVGDSLAIAETLHERHPDAGLWPADPTVRAMARWVTADMHSGYGALRSACAMVLTHVTADMPMSDKVRDGVAADLDRLEQMWDAARAVHDLPGPWLFGNYSIADAFFAPVAMRIAGYDLAVSRRARAYVAAHLNDPAVTEWRALGAARPLSPAPYTPEGTHRPWPVIPDAP